MDLRLFLRLFVCQHYSDERYFCSAFTCPQIADRLGYVSVINGFAKLQIFSEFNELFWNAKVKGNCLTFVLFIALKEANTWNVITHQLIACFVMLIFFISNSFFCLEIELKLDTCNFVHSNSRIIPISNTNSWWNGIFLSYFDFQKIFHIAHWFWNYYFTFKRRSD